MKDWIKTYLPYFKNSRELILVMMAASILFILFIPIPQGLLDFLFIINFSWALTILALSFYSETPLNFSTFPALLLLSTLLRLALNISATRLILSQGEAGQIIHAIGEYVIANNYVMGLVVFCILIIVQYTVVTHGAQRVAEVAARFTLDSMPGKQMSIDADLNMGLISAQEAQLRRAHIAKEANFYGAMDGASKFVKGDAIAGILIMLVDLMGGFAIGMADKGLSFVESIHTYSLLTIGDGLVTQIPALAISLATGIIVTRAATDAHLGQEITKQLMAYPNSLLIVCCALLGLLFLKGLPFLPIVLVLIFFSAIAVIALKHQKSTFKNITPCPQNPYEKIYIHPLELALSVDLFEKFKKNTFIFYNKIELIREQFAKTIGFFPPTLIHSEMQELSPNSYILKIQGTAKPAQTLCLNNTLGLHKKAGHLTEESLSQLIKQIQETLEKNRALLLTRDETEKLLAQPNIRVLKEELIPAYLSFTQVHRIFTYLLEEKISILPLEQIMDVLLDYAKQSNELPKEQSLFFLVEHIRTRLGHNICHALLPTPPSDERTLTVLTLSNTRETALQSGLIHYTIALAATELESFIITLASHAERMLIAHKKPILLCSGELRRPIRHLTQRFMPDLTILGMNEIPLDVQIESFSVI